MFSSPVWRVDQVYKASSRIIMKMLMMETGNGGIAGQ